MPLDASTSISTAALLDTLTGSALVLLPSAAAARSLRQVFDEAQRARGLEAWEPAPILSWSQGLDRLWSEAIVSGVETRLLLNPAQEHSLWVDTIDAVSNAKPVEATLSSSDSLADLARTAWDLANSYCATGRLRAAATTYDARTFAAWAEAFQRGCERNGYLSRAALEAALQQHIESKTLAAPSNLILAGFSEFTPAQNNLLQALRDAGTRIATHDLEAPQSPEAVRAILTAAGEHEELQAIAHWIRAFIERRRPAGQTSCVAVLLPSTDDAPAVEAVFREVLAPELQSIGADLSSTPYEFAAGRPLASLPMIAVMLDLARWAQGPLDLGNIGALLLSPYLGSSAERDQSAQFDASVLRQATLLRPEIDLPTLLRLTQTLVPINPPGWLQSVNRFLNKSGKLDALRPYADWAEFHRALAKAANWPGESAARPLTSHEFEATQAWDSLLDQLATLDFRGRRVPFAAAFRALERQANAVAFTPPSNNAPVQIMSPNAAAGMTFDALILLRATDANFPAQERANPLLGWSLQAALDMPGASQPQTAERARRTLDRLLSSAASILFTHAAETPDGAQRLSPALANLDWPQHKATLNPPPPPLQEDLIEDTAPLPPLPSPHVRGGARVLQLQAACGFRAFAEFRLNSKKLETVSLGFDAPESGRRLHSALQYFWKEIGTQDALRLMTQQEREQVLRQCIDKAMARHLHSRDVWDEAYIALQKQRMASLLQQWLTVELQRGPFSVRDSEKDLQIEVGPLALEVRFDRIDKLDEGFVLVDYKTGAAGHPKQWEGDRPDDPQLPLYALLDGENELKGIAFAKVRAGSEMKWLGYQTEPGILPASRVNEVVELSAMVERWRATLTGLAHDFADGRAAVAPKNYPQTCMHCPQRLLCRLDPASLPSAEEDESESLDG